MDGIDVGETEYTQDSFMIASNLLNSWSTVYHSLLVFKLDIDRGIDWKKYQRLLNQGLIESFGQVCRVQLQDIITPKTLFHTNCSANNPSLRFCRMKKFQKNIVLGCS